MNAAVELSHFQKNLEELKQALNSPIIYLTDFFNELCTQIDVECELYLQEHSKDEEKSSEAIDFQSQQINKVKAFEKSCLSHVAETELDETLANRITQMITKIECEVASAKDSFIAVSDELVRDKLVEVQKYLFKNRSIWFFSRSYSQKHYIFKYNSFGYLTIIMDEFLSQKRFGMTRLKFNNQDLKSNYLLSILRRKLALQAINYQSLNVSQIESYYLATIVNSLTKLSMDIFNGFTNLTLIDLSFNKLFSLDALTFQQLTSLQTLNLNNNDFIFLNPDLFKGLSNLLKLNLQNNKLLSLEPRTFHDLHRLENLDLCSNCLIHLPPNLFQDLNLKQLKLSDNQIQSLQSGLFEKLTDLINLNLSYNRLAILDQSVFEELTNLTVLNLSHNCLRKVHRDLFKNLKCLHTLSLNKNEIQSLDSDVFQGLSNLEQLSLANNSLTYLDSKTFQGLIKLKKLHLYNNRLVYLDTRLFEDLKSLQFLNLNGNSRISFEPEAVQTCTKLEIIYLGSYSFELMNHIIVMFKRNNLKVDVK